MKYMGSKRAMLTNGLGEILGREVENCSRFVDLFTGSASVAIHIATRFKVPVLAVDLQKYSAVLANAVLHRDDSTSTEADWNAWKACFASKIHRLDAPQSSSRSQKWVEEARNWCSQQSGEITKAYGGHYFSPTQAVALDCYLKCMPIDPCQKVIAHAAIIRTASHCAASPGHTAQPFQPTATAKRFLFEAWDRDVHSTVESSFKSISKLHSKVRGDSRTADALDVAQKELSEGDLCFIDPPYSDVHYSRFYHVLESVAAGVSGEVSGVGRYPDPKQRPVSDFSLKKQAIGAMSSLLSKIAKAKASAVVTFPNHKCSNGMSGEDVVKVAAEFFHVQTNLVQSHFSSLGGNSSKNHRSARLKADELILVIKPKSAAKVRSLQKKDTKGARPM